MRRPSHKENIPRKGHCASGFESGYDLELMTAERVRLGELLVQAKLMTQEALDEMLALQKQDGRRLGTLLVERGIVSEANVTQILSQQLSIPWVALQHIDFSRQMLNLVSTELVERFCLIPIYVRRVRGIGNVLYVAMDDPTNEQAIDAVAQYSGLHVRAMIAPPTDVRAALHAYYGVGEPPPADYFLSSRPPVLSLSPQSLAPDDVVSNDEDERAHLSEHDLPTTPSGLEVPDQHPMSDSVPVAPRQGDMPQPRAAARAPRLVSLRLADGSVIRLPARSAEEGDGVEAQLTAHDLIAVLKAAAGGADASQILGDAANWQGLFATLVSLLMRKGLIADWEFVDELKHTASDAE